MASNNLNLVETANQIELSLESKEFTLGKGLLQPFNESNSGSRKIMFGIQKEQSIQLVRPETPIIMTGYENKFGYYSSGYIEAESDYIVIDKIYKNASKYLILLYDTQNNVLHGIIRTDYSYHTENYGYNLNTYYLDRLQKNDLVAKGEPLLMSTSFDDALNKQDGVNLTTVYMNIALTTEDPIVLSESAAKKFESPFFDNIEIIINDNDIPLNLYGNDENYKAFPDIGEEVKKGILCAIRRERKDDEALYAQSKERLKELMASDTPYISSGEVIDIDVYCNNTDKLNDVYNSQLGKYYAENMEFCRKIVSVVDKFISSHKGIKLSYDLQKIHFIAKATINEVPYLKDKAFNNIYCNITTRTNIPVYEGDKVTDRYGGKGVISKILPDELMPYYFRFGEWHPVDAIYNSLTVNNRENPGQLYETEITYIGSELISTIAEMWKRVENMPDDYHNTYSQEVYNLVVTAERWIHTYYTILNDEEAKEYDEKIVSRLSFEERKNYLWNVIQNRELYVLVTPMKNIFTIDTLEALYNAFPFIKNGPVFRDPNYYPYVKQKDSNGNYRFVHTRRPLVVGKKYIYRLKQVAKEKFSAVSLASTNIKGENTKTKANKIHITAIPKTPVRLGGMEASELMQLPYCQYTIEAFMLLSTSPTARRLMEQLLTSDPFDRNVVLDAKSKSRNVEIVNAYLKAMGLQLVFERKPKRPKLAAQRMVVERLPELFEDHYVEPVVMLPPSITPSLVDNALKAAENAYYNNEKHEMTAKDQRIIEDAVINIMQIAKSNKDVIAKAKEVYKYTKKLHVAFINPVQIVGEPIVDDEVSKDDE